MWNIFSARTATRRRRSHHKVDGVRQLIETTGAKLLCLPPYSPDLNPIEKAWSKIKQILRALKARSTETLDQAITEALLHITADNARAWFRLCSYGTFRTQEPDRISQPLNSEEATELIRELAHVCEDSATVSILNRLGYRTGNGNTWTEKRQRHRTYLASQAHRNRAQRPEQPDIQHGGIEEKPKAAAVDHSTTHSARSVTAICIEGTTTLQSD